MREQRLPCSVGHVWIIDNFLPSDLFTEVLRQFRSDSFSDVNGAGFTNAFRIADGHVYGTRAYRCREMWPDDEPTAFSELLSKVSVELANRSADFGLPAALARSLVARGYAYPAGSSLGWHVDSESNQQVPYLAAFVYYANPTWNCRWGGELLVADTAELSRSSLLAEGLRPDFDNSQEDDVLMDLAVGKYILPRPNRLVLLPNGVAHCVRPVGASAGDHLRLSVAGFVVPPRAARS